MGLLNDIYEDGVKWHDIACYHTKVRKLGNDLIKEIVDAAINRFL